MDPHGPRDGRIGSDAIALRSKEDGQGQQHQKEPHAWLKMRAPIHCVELRERNWMVPETTACNGWHTAHTQNCEATHRTWRCTT